MLKTVDQTPLTREIGSLSRKADHECCAPRVTRVLAATATDGQGGAIRISQIWQAIFGEPLIEETAETAMRKADAAAQKAEQLKRRAAWMSAQAEEFGDKAVLLACEDAPLLSEADLALIEDYGQQFGDAGRQPRPPVLVTLWGVTALFGEGRGAAGGQAGRREGGKQAGESGAG